MKKLLSMLAAGILLAACSSDEVEIPRASDDSTASATSKTRSLDEAIRIAEEACATLFAEKGRAARSVDKSRVSVITERNSRSGASDTLIYAINFEDNGGFALISAPEAATPILAFTESGDFDECVENIGGLQLFMDNAKTYVENSESINPNVTQSFSIGDGNVELNPEYSRKYLLKIRWGLNYPAGMYCSNNNAGCCALSIAQVMSYFESPAKIDLTYEGRDKNSIELDWTALKAHYATSEDAKSHPENHTACKATEEAHQNIGRLCREIGHQIKSNYKSSGGTFSNYLYTYRYIKQVLPSKKFDERSGSTIYDALSEVENGIAIAFGSSPQGGHAWVIDGTAYVKGVTTYNFITHEYTVISPEKKFVHCNWGWDGDGNGWFIDGAFDTGSDYDKDALAPNDFKIEFNLYSYMIITE